MLTDQLSAALLLVIAASGVPLAAAALTGLAAAVFQMATQIQEQCIAFTAKFAVLALGLILFGPYLADELVSFFQSVCNSLVIIGRE